MLGHGLATDPSRTLRYPVTSMVSSAPLGLVSSLSFNWGCKEKNKIFIDVDRYTKYSTFFCYAPRNARITPLATASFGDMADSSTSIFPRIHVKDPYQHLGISREASEEEIRAARNYLISKYAGHKPSVDAIESAHDRIIMQSFFDRKKPKMNLKKKFRELNQSRAVKAIQGRFQTPRSKVIWQTAIAFVLLGVLTLTFPTEEGPTLQVAISCAANIYFIYQRVKSGWRAFFYGFGSFFASWFLGTFLMVSVIPPVLPGPRNLEVSTACVTYVLLFISSTFLK
ncbi:protein CHAPERONE-LIKE PROTEIN OF POR1, chloroplastic-like [Miscanthus floridulus]|uniref:protein CHAPERONE-LIKE PROTEIN OF POR1, chloroplastic-like n=1 Tax=Miscanthus floridulus TaxID=154761 RepID=UPI00345941FE